MKEQAGVLSNEEVLRRLGMNEQELENEVLLLLNASDEEFAAMTTQYKDAIERIAQRMMQPDEMINAGVPCYLTHPGN